MNAPGSTPGALATNERMTGNKSRRAVALAILVMVATVAAGPAMVSAQSDDGGVIDTLFGSDSEDESSTSDTVISAVMGWVSKQVDKASAMVGMGSEDLTAEDYVADVKATYNPNSTAVENWTNARVDADSAYDVARIKFTDSDGGGAYLFVVADINGTEYVNSRVMNLTEFRKTDRSVDLDYRLSPYASRNAADELETFISEYAKPGKDVTNSYLAGIAGQYRGEISGDDLPGRDG